MSKTFKITFAVFLLLVALLTYLEATEPEPVNWTPSYMPVDKIPLGSYVFFHSWKDNDQADIQEVNLPPYEFLLKEHEKGTYFFLNQNIYFDDDELNDLLDWVGRGNDLFLSAQVISSNLLDTLHLERKTYVPGSDLQSIPHLNFVNPKLKSDSAFAFKNDFEAAYFSKIDTANTEVLGSVSFDPKKKEKVNFIKMKFGEGEIILHITPQAFGNYFLLTNENYRYAEKALAYINKDGKVYWDNYYKAGKSFYTSPLYIFLKNRALKWAYYFVIFGSLLFIIFEGKRRQRPIPVVKPLRNQSYDYAQSIADLYLEQNRYKELALKKIALFLEYVRMKYRISTENIDNEFYRDLASRSGNSLPDTEALFSRFQELQEQKNISQKEFQALCEAINTYKTTKNGK
ncbi:MAG: DUF4350 domain-containing protein [Salegentibacter sp.]